METKLPGIDIVTLIYNAEHFLERYFESFKKLNYPKHLLRINLIDNSPNDRSLKIINEKYLNNPEIPYPVRVVKSEKNLGFSGGNNFLFEKLVDESDFPFFFLLNQDGALEPECIMQLGRGILNYPDTGLYEAKQSPREHPKWYDPETFETSWCSGGGVLIRKQALKEVGFFDHNFFLYCEDVDLSWRMWLKNWKCRICPSAVYEHLTEELDENKDQTIRYFYSFRNGFYMNLKYNSFVGILKYYVMAFLVCFKQDRIRKKAFLRAFFNAQKLAPHYICQRLKNPIKNAPSWIYFDRFDFGKRRKFKDIPNGRVFLD